jgi:hypothetical protein
LDHNLDELEDGGVRGYIVMPEAAGSIEDFADTFRDRPEVCLEVLEGILDGLVAAHDKGIVHRDLKPANILFMDRSVREPLIADFGVCLLRETSDEDRVTEVGETVGARYFMAPEQERGGVADVSPSADLYALGKLLYYMLTGRNIYREDLDVAFDPDALASDLRLQRIQEKILRPTVMHDPEDRIQTARDLLAVVRGMRQQPTVRPEADTEPVVENESPEPDSGPDETEDGETATAELELPDLLTPYRVITEKLATGRLVSIELEFDDCAREFQGVWERILAEMESSPDRAEEASRRLIAQQQRIIVLTLAMARTDAMALYPQWKSFIERILSVSEGRSGYPAVLSAPHVFGGFLYMLASVVAYSHQKWNVFGALLTRKFEWQYRSPQVHFSEGFLLSQFFHADAIGRYANKAHDLYRELLSSPSVVAVTGLADDDLLNTYLQVQFLMTMRAVQLCEAGQGADVWPDYGRFHGERLNRLLYRIEKDEGYAAKIAGLFGESVPEFRERLPRRMSVPPREWWSGARFFWDSHASWDFETD